MASQQAKQRVEYLDEVYLSKVPGPRCRKANDLCITEGQLNRYFLAGKNASVPSPQTIRIAQLLAELRKAGIEPPEPPYHLY